MRGTAVAALANLATWSLGDAPFRAGAAFRQRQVGAAALANVATWSRGDAPCGGGAALRRQEVAAAAERPMPRPFVVPRSARTSRKAESRPKKSSVGSAKIPQPIDM